MVGMLTIPEMLQVPAEETSDGLALNLSPLVSVLMMTRNHERYVEQAVESVMAQQCGFKFEILIGEDYSTDNTRTVCETLQKKYPQTIRLIVAARNVGITGNFLRLVARAKGKYAAFLEGDDYWTATNKLQQQVELMEAHPEFSWCGARTANRTFWVEKKPFYVLEDILRRYIFHTSSVLFRRELLDHYPKFPDTVCWESMLLGYLTDHGLCGFIDEEFSYYRRHEGGLWHNADRMKRIQMSRDCIDALAGYFGGRYRRELADREAWIYAMDMASPGSGRFLTRWKQSMGILWTAFPRVYREAPVSLLVLWVRLLAQPLTAPLAKVRRLLGLRQRRRALLRLIGL